MNTAELKLKLFRQIDELDKEKLKEIYGVVLNYLNSKDDEREWNKLTTQQQQGIIDSIKKLENNEGLDHEDVMKKYRAKFNA